MAARPAISVILSTYNWSSALRLALRSVLLQTRADFEVLVVGDGCTDDSEAVVASFDDPRFKWHNLEQNHGSQWAPNNRGLELARADWVAYLGQDDIWHPRHLAACLETAERSGADLVASVAIMYGPKRSGIRSVSGIFADRVHSPRDLIPPSSMAHRRSLVDRIGLWQSQRETRLPVDCAFLKAALDSGTSIASTNELTVFKFNAAWRRDSYVLKPVDEQDAMLRRIESGEDFRQDELMDVLQAVVSDRFARVEMPTAAPLDDLSYHDRNRVFKGAEPAYSAPQLADAAAPSRFTIDGPQAFEWYPEENHPQFGTYHWSGPAPCSTVTLPVRADRDLAIKVHVLQMIDDSARASLKVFAQMREVPFSIALTGDGTHMLTFSAPPSQDDARQAPLKIAFDVGRTRRPLDLGINGDRRWLGLAVNWIEVSGERAGSTLSRVKQASEAKRDRS